jgi:hypothetical protein
MARLIIRQIFYDAETLSAVRDGYLPLDNSDGPAGWFEFWPMLKFARETALEDDVWYGVVSPKFPEKAGVTQQQIEAIAACSGAAEVLLFTYDWASLASSLNPWVHGEQFHPGLINCMQGFLRTQGQNVDLTRIISDLDTSVYANYFFAKREFWKRWLALAEAYLAYVEAGGVSLADNVVTVHRGAFYPMRVFVQERLVCWLLLTSNVSVARPDYTREVPLPPYGPFCEVAAARTLLRLCDAIKRRARRRGRNSRPLSFRVASYLLWRLIALARDR